jgi:hypothetical protein
MVHSRVDEIAVAEVANSRGGKGDSWDPHGPVEKHRMGREPGVDEALAIALPAGSDEGEPVFDERSLLVSIQVPETGDF